MNAVYFLLAKIETNSAGNDRVQLAWIDDVNDLPEEEAAVTWSLEQTGHLSGIIDSIRIEGGTNAEWNVDALRIGSTFDAVVFTDGVVPEVLGDLTADGQITILDWHALKLYYGLDTSGMTIPQQQDLGDFDSNGIVNIADFLRFRGLYDASNGAGRFCRYRRPFPNHQVWQ